ncbi:MAG: hypothetical protein NWE76_06105, partial [Candidatus Bathyarchaeota archaeon]|nr:hypothetical protein [Candidatus Bathyarchaeota archaeon]
GYGLFPKEPGILSEEQIRQIVIERPRSIHLEVKLETVEFVKISLEFTIDRLRCQYFQSIPPLGSTFGWLFLNLSLSEV